MWLLMSDIVQIWMVLCSANFENFRMQMEAEIVLVTSCFTVKETVEIALQENQSARYSKIG